MALGQAGLVKELFDVIDCMRSPPRKKFKLDPLQNWDPRLEPDLIVYNAVSNIYRKFYVQEDLINQETTSLDLLAIWSSVVQYTSILTSSIALQVLNACVQQKQWEGAFWVLQQLKEKNIRPTNTTYGLVMEVC